MFVQTSNRVPQNECPPTLSTKLTLQQSAHVPLWHCPDGQCPPLRLAAWPDQRCICLVRYMHLTRYMCLTRYVHLWRTSCTVALQPWCAWQHSRELLVSSSDRWAGKRRRLMLSLSLVRLMLDLHAVWQWGQQLTELWCWCWNHFLGLPPCGLGFSAYRKYSRLCVLLASSCTIAELQRSLPEHFLAVVGFVCFYVCGFFKYYYCFPHLWVCFWRSCGGSWWKVNPWWWDWRIKSPVSLSVQGTATHMQWVLKCGCHQSIVWNDAGGIRRLGWFSSSFFLTSVLNNLLCMGDYHQMW